MATKRQKTPCLGRSGWRLVGTLVAVLGLAAAGCVGHGILYTRVVRPYSREFHATPVGAKTCRLNQHIFREPATGADVSVQYTLRVVEQAAREAGITKFHYADLETLSFLNGLYEVKTLIVYGD